MDRKADGETDRRLKATHEPVIDSNPTPWWSGWQWWRWLQRKHFPLTAQVSRPLRMKARAHVWKGMRAALRLLWVGYWSSNWARLSLERHSLWFVSSVQGLVAGVPNGVSCGCKSFPGCSWRPPSADACEKLSERAALASALLPSAKCLDSLTIWVICFKGLGCISGRDSRRGPVRHHYAQEGRCSWQPGSASSHLGPPTKPGFFFLFVFLALMFW